MARKAWLVAMAAIGSAAALAWGNSPGPATRPSPPATQPAAAAQDAADAPTYITLHVKNAKPANVLKDISAQAHVRVTGWPEMFWTGQQPGIIPNVTLDLNHVTFWTAIEAVCKITRSRPQYIGQGQPSDISLIMGNLGNWDQEGQFAFIPMLINHSSQVDLNTGGQIRDDSMTIEVYLDPKIHHARWDAPHLTVAEDEHGISMLSTGRASNMPVWGFQPAWSITTNAPLAFPPRHGAMLARVEGTMVFHIETEQTLQINDLTAAAGKSATIAGQTATVIACSFDGNSTVTLHVRLSRDGHPGDEPGAGGLEQEFRSARIVDAAGQQLLPKGSGAGSNTQLDWEGSFSGGRRANGPFSLRLPIVTTRPPITVAFKFKDVPLPPR